MKKILSSLLALTVLIALVGCGGSTGSNEEKISIGFVTDIGGIDDKSFNQTSYEGLEKFANEAGLVVGEDLKYLQSATESDYIPNLSQFADVGTDLIVAAGYLFSDAMSEIVTNYPDQKMLIIDVDWLSGDNLQQAVFAEHEGSFLVGVVAALAAQAAGQDTFGMVLGSESVTMAKFYAGYEAGILAVMPEATILYDNAGAFNTPEVGKTLAAKQYNAGAYVVFHAAGGTGNGVIQEAADRRQNGEDVWVIGVDTNQYDYGIYDGTNSAVLTSMLKRVELASYNAAKAIADGTFEAGVVRYTLADGGVGLPAENPNFSNEVFEGVDFDAAVAEWTEKIVSGEVVVPEVSETGRGVKAG
ncbi:MAG: BMP family ABC transporter substrate-binding protein [Erysipelotrichaceae bacterium]